MKVFDLTCEHAHRFEGWFASAQQYEEQLGQGLIQCPVCASPRIKKLLSAPRLNLSGSASAPVAPRAGEAGLSGPERARVQALVKKVAEVLMAHTENVGAGFAAEARRIHLGEAPERAIRGTASAHDLEALRDDGIEVFALPLLDVAEGPLH